MPRPPQGRLTAPARQASAAVGPAETAPETPFCRHFTAAELAELWKLDESTIRRLFQDEPGVFCIGKCCRRDGKRDYVTLRIPESVVWRVYKQRCK